jgi:lon-related putative ATP-dependent protease
MPTSKHPLKLSLETLRWRCDPQELPFTDTTEVEPLDDILGQDRGVEAFRFGMGLNKKGYNIMVTGEPGLGRMATVRKLLEELSDSDEVPDDLCYVNNFKRPEEPILLRFKAGRGLEFRRGMQDFLETLKREIGPLFESEEYIQRKNEIAEAHEKKVMRFYKTIEEKVKDTGLVVVRMQMGPFQRPDVVPLVDDEPKRMIEVEEMVEAGRFPREEFEKLKERRESIKQEIDDIVVKVRELQKEVARKHEEVDRLMFTSMAEEAMKELREAHPDPKVQTFLDSVLEDMLENLDSIRAIGGSKEQEQQQAIPFMAGPSPEAILHPYEVNLLVDNSERSRPPVIVESYPTYRNLFGSIERVMDRQGGWRTDFSKIKAGSFVSANGGYLVINLMDAIMEPGVWQTLKRSLKTEEIEIETFDPYYFITATGLKPEPITMDVKVVALCDHFLYRLLRFYDPDAAKTFKVRADYETSMDRTADAVVQVARFIRGQVDKEELSPFSASGAAAVVEEAVRMAGRQEKLTTAFPRLADLLLEADFAARKADSHAVDGEHVREAVAARDKRVSRVEERIQEMIDRGSLFVDVEGEAVGQVNGLAVYSTGDYAFGKPTRITAVASIGKEGIINIEREADLSGPIHNKGMLILAGYLRKRYAQDKPLSLAASIAFEQSYGGVDGDSASSTEVYALLSSLSGKPLRQDVAVTGSVNQNGEVQPIGGVNQKIEGFYHCCKNLGFTGNQGVMIPQANVKDLMLKQEVLDSVQAGEFHVWAVSTIDEGVELLTGAKAGRRTKTGRYTKGSVNALVDAKLQELAEGLRDFVKESGEEGGKSRKSSKSGKK